jgi:hypothetical protein
MEGNVRSQIQSSESKEKANRSYKGSIETFLEVDPVEALKVQKRYPWIAPIIAQWTDEAICFNLGASIAEIHDAEKKIGFRFPETFKIFYLQVNGFKRNEWISNMFAIWSLERILEEYHDSRDKNFVGFADWLINSHQIGFVKGQEGIFKYYDSPEKIAETFEAGLMLINQDSKLLY